jgi:hypothetical protein
MNKLTRLLVQGFVLLSSCVAVAADDSAAQADYAAQANGSVRSKQTADIKKDISEIVGLLNKGGDSADAAKASKELERMAEYEKLLPLCAEREKRTEFICRENTNPALTQSIPIIQALMTGIAGVKDACSKFAKATELLNKAILAYQATCATVKALCQSSCSKAQEDMKRVGANLPNIIDSGVDRINQSAAAANAAAPGSGANLITVAEALAKTKDPIAEKVKTEMGNASDTISSNLQTCSGFDKQLASAAIGIISIVKSMGESNQCNKATTVPTPTPAVNCALPENKTLTLCICQTNERAVGCGSGLNTSANAKNANPMAPTSLMSASTVSGKEPALPGGNAGEEPIAGSDSKGTGSGGGTGAPAGGGAGMDAGGLGASAPATANQKAGSRLNSNILAGEGGGGGGGGGWGGGEESSTDPALRKYLPGGEKDPKGVAGQASIKQVTSEGGKSNWEKVRERYRENKPTLLGY